MMPMEGVSLDSLVEEKRVISSQTRSARSSSDTSARVLLIDDSEDILEVLSELLHYRGYEVDSASSASLAYSQLNSVTPDIIICDVNMPGQSGFDFFKELKKSDRWASIPFVFLTAYGNLEEQRLAKESGCDDYLIKPFEEEDILAVIRGRLLLAQQRENQERTHMELFRKRIIHTLSHEFRTPLVSINTGSELLLDKYDALGPEQIEKLLRSILRGGNRLERLVDDFMLLQKIDLGHSKYTSSLCCRPCQLASLMQTAIDDFLQSLTDGASCEVILEYVDPNLYIDVYDVQIRDALHRLLDNARKFGGQDGEIRVCCREEKHLAIIEIIDQGPGLNLSQENQTNGQDALYAFSQIGRDLHEQQGCGLGLTIAASFAEINGGELLLRDRPHGCGLLVQLRFPLNTEVAERLSDE